MEPFVAGVKHYLTQGILTPGNLAEQGGPQCHAQIPAAYHWSLILVISVSCIYILRRWNQQLANPSVAAEPTLLEKIAGVASVVSLVLTLYCKISTKKGLFILNPCHITLALEAMLLCSTNTPAMKKLHTIWGVWTYGAVLALFAPHLEGIDSFQIVLYYVEHLLIIPLGPLLLYRRYGCQQPTLKRHLIAFTTVILYQVIVLAALGRLTMVNLNFALCHSSADPIYSLIGHHYFIAGVFYLNLASFLLGFINYLLLSLIFYKGAKK